MIPHARPLAILMSLALSLSCSHAQSRPTPDGIYKPTSLEAYVTLGGKRLNLPLRSLRTALLRDSLFPVYENRVRIQRSKWGPVLEKFNFLGIDGRATVNSPDNLVFKRNLNANGDRFDARLSFPLQISMKGRYKWAPVTVRLKTPLDSTIRGDTLTIDAPLRVTVLHITASGRLRMTAERQTSFP